MVTYKSERVTLKLAVKAWRIFDNDYDASEWASGVKGRYVSVRRFTRNVRAGRAHMTVFAVVCYGASTDAV